MDSKITTIFGLRKLNFSAINTAAYTACVQALKELSKSDQLAVLGALSHDLSCEVNKIGTVKLVSAISSVRASMSSVRKAREAGPQASVLKQRASKSVDPFFKEYQDAPTSIANVEKRSKIKAEMNLLNDKKSVKFNELRHEAGKLAAEYRSGYDQFRRAKGSETLVQAHEISGKSESHLPILKESTKPKAAKSESRGAQGQWIKPKFSKRK